MTTTGEEPHTQNLVPAWPLAGRRVLVPRPDASDPIARAVEHAGGQALTIALTESVPAADAVVNRALDFTGAAWLVLTSARTVTALASQAQRTADSLQERLTRAVAAGMRIAVVGPATARALAEFGQEPHLRAGAPESAATLLQDFPAATADARVLLPCSALASPELADGLRALGWAVERAEVYSTRTAQLGEAERAQLTQPWPDVVLLTAGSTVRALHALLGPPPAEVALAAIGASAAEAAQEAGMRVDAVAAEATPAGLISAAAHALRHRPLDLGAHG